MSKSLKEKIASAKLPERVVTLCLRGDLLARHAKLLVELSEARREADSSLAGGNAHEVLEQLEALRLEMLEDSIELRLRAMPSRSWDELIRAHPPRPDNPIDQRVGFYPYGFYRQALMEACVEPQLDAEDWLALVGDEGNDGALTDAQWDELTTAVYELNRHAVNIPFLPSNWRETLNSGLA